MKIFFDTEFTGLHKDTTLISLGMISEDGRRFYAEFNDYDKTQVNKWIMDNVIAYMSFKDDYIPDLPISSCSSYAMKADTATIKSRLIDWLNQFEYVELVSDVSHYDMVLFINIFGTAFDLPNHVCPACIDINQMIADYHEVDIATAFDVSREEMLKVNDIKIKGNKHNALYDAKVIRALYNLMKEK